MCQSHLVQVQGYANDFAKLGTKIIVVVLSKPQTLALYLQNRQTAFSFISDPERKLYQAFGLDRVPMWKMFLPWVLLSYLWTMLKGYLVRLPKKDEDVLQLGGDFLLNRDRTLVYAHRSSNPADRPSPGRLLQEIQKHTLPGINGA